MVWSVPETSSILDVLKEHCTRGLETIADSMLMGDLIIVSPAILLLNIIKNIADLKIFAIEFTPVNTENERFLKLCRQKIYWISKCNTLPPNGPNEDLELHTILYCTISSLDPKLD